MDAGRVDYKGATCAPRTCRLGKGVTDVDTGHVRYEEVAWTSNIAPRTYLLGDAVITNIYSSGGPWVGILTGLFEPLDKEVYFKDERVRCTIRWLDAFAGRAKKNDETSLLRRTKIEPVPGELYMYDISDPFSKPVAHIGGRAFLATIPEALEELQPARGISRRRCYPPRSLLLPTSKTAVAHQSASRRRARTFAGRTAGRTGVSVGKRRYGGCGSRLGAVEACDGHRVTWSGVHSQLATE